MKPQTSFDYIVVGAGSSGCVVANRLSRKHTVLLLEAGGPDVDPDIHHSFVPAIFRLWASPGCTRQYAVARRDGAGLGWPQLARGIVRGGSSSINGMIYVRGNRRDYDGWAAAGAKGWSYDRILPCFTRSEDFEGGASEYHGSGGPLAVRRLVAPTPVAHAFAAAAVEAGFDGPDRDFNGERQEGGAGLYQVNVTPDGRRASAAVAFLDPLRRRRNLTEIDGMLVHRIEIERERATGVRCLNRTTGAATLYRARREVVVCAGAFESPRLLMLSGLGPGRELARHCIPTRVDLPGVGQNLQDHLFVFMYFRARRKLPQPRFIAEAGLFLHTHGQRRSESPALQYHVCAGMRAVDVPGVLDPPNFLVCPTVVQPRSRGWVGLLSGDPRHPPLIQPNYLARREDVKVLLEGVDLARDLVGRKAFRGLAGPELAPALGPRQSRRASRFESDEDFVRRMARTVWHPVGTCRMGAADDPTAVVNPELRVRGVRGLRVADASIMPTITAGNTNAACTMIGEKAAELILGEG